MGTFKYEETLYVVSTDIPNQSVALVPVKWYGKQPQSVGPLIIAI